VHLRAVPIKGEVTGIDQTPKAGIGECAGAAQARENSAFDRQNVTTTTSLLYARPPNTTLTSVACQSNFLAAPTTDKQAPYPEAFDASIKEKVLPSDCKLRRVNYLDNVIEQELRLCT
jgi:hypothetical protein